MTKHFTLTLRVASGRDGVRSLRTLLKIAGRHLGLRAVSVRESGFDKHSVRRRRSAHLECRKSGSARRQAMDMREFKKSKFLKVENCREPRQMRIAGVVMGKYGKPDLIFENGDRLGLSATNAEILSDAYGWESEAWAGHLIEVNVGQGQFEGDMVDMVLVKPLSKAEGDAQVVATESVKKAPNKPPQQKSVGNSMDDEIPF
jgi:hypothetical protein